MIYHMYGCNGSDIDHCKDLLQDNLGIAMEGRESSYLGGVYYRYRYNNRSFQMFNNWDVMEDEPIYPEFSGYKVLLSVSIDDHFWENDSDALARMGSLVLLK